ncbi:MAG: ATP synthase F0 subunit A [Bacteroidetes bacterium GWF2_40_14]|nr:MAG: ATP synthase F0 subunit A [Bacteroidetes bacterium GWF2_40_14]
MKRKIKILVSLLFLMVYGRSTILAEEIDVKQIVFSHLRDSYGWHIATWGDTHVTVPLPVIVFSKTTGLNIFLSSELENGKTYKYFRISREERHLDKVVEINSAGNEVRPIDLSLTKNALALLLNSIILILIILHVAKWYKKKPVDAPRGFTGAMEIFIMDINDNIIKSCIGKDYLKYSPYLLTAFFFIFTNNIMGIIPLFPGGANTTGNIAVTMGLALCTFLAVNIFGTKEYWKEILWPDVPLWMKVPLPLLPVIEIFALFTKPFALMIRLFANIMAGHAIILGLTSLIFVTVAMGPAVNSGMTLLSVILSVFMIFVEILVAYIQAYVFTMLSAVFIGLSRVEKHKQEVY